MEDKNESGGCCGCGCGCLYILISLVILMFCITWCVKSCERGSLWEGEVENEPLEGSVNLVRSNGKF